jgi:hypothetical protein
VWEAYQGWKKTGRVRPRNNNKRRKFKK